MAHLWAEHHWWRKSLTRSFTSNEFFHLNHRAEPILSSCAAAKMDAAKMPLCHSVQVSLPLGARAHNNTTTTLGWMRPSQLTPSHCQGQFRIWLERIASHTRGHLSAGFISASASLLLARCF